MVDKKRSIVVIAFGIIFLILAIYQGFWFFLTIFHFEKIINRPNLIWLSFSSLIKAIFFFLLSIGILKLKQFTCKVLLCLFYFYIFLSIVYIASDWYKSSFSILIKKDILYFLLIPFASLGILAFTRKSIKEQFYKYYK